jgi:hypothetical protein
VRLGLRRELQVRLRRFSGCVSCLCFLPFLQLETDGFERESLAPRKIGAPNLSGVYNRSLFTSSIEIPTNCDTVPINGMVRLLPHGKTAQNCSFLRIIVAELNRIIVQTDRQFLIWKILALPLRY